MKEEPKPDHLDLSECSEHVLFDDHEPSSSKEVTLEEEKRVAVMGGGRLPRFSNLLSELRFLCRMEPRFKDGNQYAIAHAYGRFKYARTVVGPPPVASSQARCPTHEKITGRRPPKGTADKGRHSSTYSLEFVEPFKERPIVREHVHFLNLRFGSGHRKRRGRHDCC